MNDAGLLRPRTLVYQSGVTTAEPPTARRYIMPVNAHLIISDGEMVNAGDVLAKIPREVCRAWWSSSRRGSPRDPAVISEIDGRVKYGGVVKGQRKVLIVPDDPNAEPREYSIPRGVHVNVQEGERVRAGDR